MFYRLSAYPDCSFLEHSPAVRISFNHPVFETTMGESDKILYAALLKAVLYKRDFFSKPIEIDTSFSMVPYLREISKGNTVQIHVPDYFFKPFIESLFANREKEITVLEPLDLDDFLEFNPVKGKFTDLVIAGVTRAMKRSSAFDSKLSYSLYPLNNVDFSIAARILVLLARSEIELSWDEDIKALEASFLTEFIKDDDTLFRFLYESNFSDTEIYNLLKKFPGERLRTLRDLFLEKNARKRKLKKKVWLKAFEDFLEENVLSRLPRPIQLQLLFEGV